ncbi:hypothetical protein CTAYLR_007930, partial [Chrysophaeum taylorii]
MLQRARFSRLMGARRYVLLEIARGVETRLVVRSISGLLYHAEVYEVTAAQFEPRVPPFAFGRLAAPQAKTVGNLVS